MKTTAYYLIFILNAFSKPLCHVNGSGVILEESTPISIEMF